MNPSDHIHLPPTLDPGRFSFWRPGEDARVTVGAEQIDVPLPQILLPINKADLEDGPPGGVAIGQGLYDYLRQFPDCPHNTVYAELLREAYPHYLADIASQAVLLEAKDVETVHVRRKLTGLKILALVEPRNEGLLLQLCRGYYELALSFEELGDSRRHLLQAMRYGQELLKVAPKHVYGLHLLAEIDIMFGDFPGADAKWRRALEHADDTAFQQRIADRKQAYAGRPWSETNLVDDLEAVHKAMELFADGHYTLALAIMDRLEEERRFAEEMPSAEYHYLLGMCRNKTGDTAGAVAAFERALELNEEYEPAREARDSLQSGAEHV